MIPAMDTASQRTLLLICRIGELEFAVPGASVERVARMAAVSPLPGAPSTVLGALNVEGISLPVVDPHPVFSQPSPHIHPDQHLLLMAADDRFVLWVDRVERVALVDDAELEPVPLRNDSAMAAAIAHIDQDCVPVLNLGPLVATSLGGLDASDGESGWSA